MVYCHPTTLHPTMSQGFAITFDIPFHREDVWRELHAPQPLGMHSAVRVKVPRKAELRAKAARGAVKKFREDVGIDEVRGWHGHSL